MTEAIEFSIPGLAPQAANPNSREHWSKLRGKAAEGVKYAMDVLLIAQAAIPPDSGCPWPKAHVTLTQQVVTPRDHDNFAASFKPGLDAIIRAGIIVDDSPKHMDLSLRSVRVAHKADQAVLVRIEKQTPDV
jgi:hypothetical protein